MPDLVQIRMPLAAHPLWCRFESNDVHAFHQVFVRREYAAWTAPAQCAPSDRLRANVGYTSAYSLSRFPHARLVAIEVSVR